MKKWKCNYCYEIYSTKKELVHDLKDHFEEGTQQAEEAVSQLEELGVKNPYLP